MSGRKAYYEGEQFLLDDDERRRCVSVHLKGYNEPFLLRGFITLVPEHIDFCFGEDAVNVQVLLSNRKREYLANWLHSSRYPLSKLLGFYGPENTTLNIVLADGILL